MLRILAKYLSLLLLCTVVLVSCQHQLNSGLSEISNIPDKSLRIATYNVHYINTLQERGNWSLDDWRRRKTPLDTAFKNLNASIIAFQEMESFSGGHISSQNLALDWLLAQNPDYAAAATGDPNTFPSTQPIFYHTEKLQLLDQGWFFFSDTPQVIYSRTFNDSYPAFASWAEFRHRQLGTVFKVVNIHTDFGSRSNRQQSIALVASTIRPWIEDGQPVIVAGDLNARRGAKMLEVLEHEGIEFAQNRGSTYHFNRGINLFGAIDHIGTSEGFEITTQAMVLRQKFGGEWPTDHYPVALDLKIPESGP